MEQMQDIYRESDEPLERTQGSAITILVDNIPLISISEVRFLNLYLSGDLLDEGKWCSNEEFRYHVKRFKKMFEVPSGTDVYVVDGNHDIGFHYM
jgi:metallophosphoesterase superfamily enzyme